MEKAVYRVVRDGERWVIEHDSEKAGPYETKQAAFEAAVLTAGASLSNGHEIELTVEGGEGGLG